jgi:hypothetical protein
MCHATHATPVITGLTFQKEGPVLRIRDGKPQVADGTESVNLLYRVAKKRVDPTSDKLNDPTRCLAPVGGALVFQL